MTKQEAGPFRPGFVLIVAVVAALVVFAVVQDRVTATGARQYVALQKQAMAGQGPPVTLDAIMRPAIRRSVEYGLLWSAAVMGVGVVAAAAMQRRSTRRNGRRPL